MNQIPLVSLCIPTNGVIEWVFPVLDSIYAQGVSEDLFEVVITDNGSNEDFRQQMLRYCQMHNNLVYEKTDALPFLNEIESYKRASGEFIKFINHRTLLSPETLDKFISFVSENRDEKPIIYFTNGVLNMTEKINTFACFEEYVKNLSYWSSWSTGMGIWKTDFNSIPEDIVFNELFPHTTILFWVRNREKYIIDNTPMLSEIPSNQTKKGKYDLFFAFAVEYPGILCDLLREKGISMDTFLKLKKDCLRFVAELYWVHILRRVPCSYDLSGYKKSVKVFYSNRQVMIMVIKNLWRRIKKKI